MVTYNYIYLYPPKEGFSSNSKRIPNWKFYSYDNGKK